MQHVTIGLLFNENNEILIALRPPHVLEPGICEFPGGKVEPNETLENALIREYREEIGIEITRSEFLFSIDTAHSLTLHVFQIHDYVGIPYGRENQTIRFVPTNTLKNYVFPKANATIVAYLLQR